MTTVCPSPRPEPYLLKAFDRDGFATLTDAVTPRDASSRPAGRRAATEQ
jgi:hypothetical protein